MKRYDYLIQKRERKYREGKRLSIEEDEELRILRPNVFTPIFMMFELLHDTVKTNQQHRQTSKRTITNQTGGAQPPASTAAVNAVTTAAVAAAQNLNSQGSATAPPTADAGEEGEEGEEGEAGDAEAKRLSELEESLLPLLTKIIVYIEENKKAETKKGDDGDEEEKYPDIGTTAKNSAILVIRRIKKWWNDLISGGSSDLSSKINLKKMIPQLANNPDDMNNLIKTDEMNNKIDEMNKLAEKATDAIHNPLQKIEKILSNDVRDIASSSVEGIMNALSLIPGIGTTLQLWRLLQNVIVIMSKSVTTMAGAKTEGVNLKNSIQTIKGDLEKMADPTALANAAANAAKDKAMSQVQGAVANQAGALAAANPIAGLAGASPATALGGVIPPIPSAGGALGGVVPPIPSVGGALGGMMPQGGGAPRKTNHLRSIKKYKREYKQSIREIRKTRKNILRCIKNMI
jgi:hypothetical protein